MAETAVKQVMIASPASSSGKTTLTCALLKALKDRGLDPAAFKCGPDYIDPLFHQKVIGVESRNLDTYFAGKEGIQKIMSSYGGRYAVIEGVMGIYDGANPEGIEGSCYEVAKALCAPVILVADASATSRTVISVIKGILLDDTDRLIKGIILNKMSQSLYERLGPVLEKELSELRGDVKLLGYFPKKKEVTIGSRHLGLMLPGEVDDIKQRISESAKVLEDCISVEKIVAIMEAVPKGSNNCRGTGEDCVMKTAISNEKQTFYPGTTRCEGLSLSVAMDEAFCFYYRDNLDIFREKGVEVNFFSPLHDGKLPEKCDAILLGGGYPENHLSELAENKAMLISIKNAIEKGIPSLAECGGFMYLHKSIADMEKRPYEMVGAVDGECHFTDHLVRFGYMQIERETHCLPGDELIHSLVGMKGHEFHYCDSTMNGNTCLAVKPGKDIKWECMVTGKNAIWGFPHFYYRSAPLFIDAFIERMRKVKYG